MSWRPADRRIDLTRLPHRLADAAIRATALAGEIRRCFEALESGDPEPLARIAPTTLVYGAWDSRDTQVRLPRAIGSTIRAFDVSCAHPLGAVHGGVRASGAGPE